MWGAQQVRAQKRLPEVLRQNFALTERFAGFRNRTGHHRKLAKAVECTGSASLTANDLIRKEGKSAGTIV